MLLANLEIKCSYLTGHFMSRRIIPVTNRGGGESGLFIPFSSCVHICFVSTSELLYLLQLCAVRLEWQAINLVR